MSENNNKLYELTINENGIRFRHANPHPLDADHKFYITLALIVAALLAELMWLMAGH